MEQPQPPGHVDVEPQLLQLGAIDGGHVDGEADDALGEIIDQKLGADGRYVVKVVASDAPDNPPAQRLTGERLSEPVDIDNTPPQVKLINQPQITSDRVRLFSQLMTQPAK